MYLNNHLTLCSFRVCFAFNTARPESTKAQRESKGLSRPSNRTSNLVDLQSEDWAADERESKCVVRTYSASTSHRDRVSPEKSSSMLAATRTEGSSRHRLSQSKNRSLKVDIHLARDADGQYTPNTAASTPTSKNGVRNNRDLRSPGQNKTPKASDKGASTPDFITQTDRFGHASTPRSGDAISKARQQHPTGATPRLHVGKDGKLHEDDDGERGPVEACTETLLDSLRLMCCCLMPDDGQPRVVKSQATAEEEFEPEELDRPKLLPTLHPDDHGKPCLVLDLDETLVHSSFRAVPGADFVIPVQVCILFDHAGKNIVLSNHLISLILID